MKKIIVPIDFSEHSEYALKTAATLAKKHDAEVLVLHMLEMSTVALTASDELLGQQAIFFMKLAEKKFKDFLDKDYLKGVNVTPIIKHFKVFSEVNDVAKENNVDIIVMGSHGSSGIQEMFIGSNTERVVRNSEIPVLIVKNNVVDVNFDVIVLATDLEEESIQSYINTRKMFQDVASKIYLVHVNLPNERFQSTTELEKKAVHFFTKADRSLNYLEDLRFVSDYTVDDGILHFSNKSKADLIVMPTHGRKGLAHFFQGSVGEDVVNHSTLPVLTIKME
ncbi:universal stress protein [Algibacter sp. L4_22]|uniref:universal stress protein n=1 Tax=Algibacter sp. L4_22 TaxID=2942477 RepID=UPI00201B6720|nr:universal stress protein [Algibacter sp. L4_22]MCL5128796.1 universal stress protein [Algibacter sp. L4_22]